MTQELISSGLASLNFSRQALLGLLDGIPAEKLTHQLTPGGNHALWIAGHIANADDFFLSTLAGTEPKHPDKWRDLFGQGSKPINDAAAYPSLDDVKQALANRREELLAWFQSLSSEKLAEPLPADYQQFAPNFGAFPGTLAWHEGLHAGQLSMIRRDLGLGFVFG